MQEHLPDRIIKEVLREIVQRRMSGLFAERSRELKKKLGEVEMAKILQGGNLLVKCRNKEQRK